MATMTPRQWRTAIKLTLEEAAAAVGISGKNPARTWQRWEVGERAPPATVVARVEKLSDSRVKASDWPSIVDGRRRAA
ncbi:helix-turn-helix transcriptional regulator [Aureimonas sp. AU22]|uniref:helix-turn-helix domain-containing protein n=1 Tax=Aureimonas sp. AU22 TaxID=1638162 RepID=UPI00078387CD